jgi:ApeA N-terminal domain 1
MPETHDTPTYSAVHYPIDSEQEFPLTRGRIVIAVETSRYHDLTLRTLTLTQQGWINFKLDSPLSIDEARKLYFDIEDLLILLTDQECGLDWPRIQMSDSDGAGTLYCTRRRPPKSKFSAFNCWVLFSQIAHDFGTIVDSWIEMRKKFGPAFHLYLGTRRGVDLYTEHRFVNLVWGLEALHRQSRQTASKPRLESKIKRILDSIGPELKSKDRGWLEDLLDKSREPSLAERLEETISELPLTFADKSVNRFAKKCARLRNDISHFGGPRPGGGYDAFVLELHQLSGALDQLYHAAILYQIGIPDEQIRHIFFKGITSFQIRSRLHQAGLYLVEPSR